MMCSETPAGPAVMATPLSEASDDSVSDPDVDGYDDFTDLGWCEIPVPAHDAPSEPTKGGSQSGDTDLSTASTCPTTPHIAARSPGAKTVEEVLAIATRATAAHTAACADVDAAMAALAAAKHAGRRQPKEKEIRAALAAAAADVKTAEHRAEELRKEMFAASQALDVAKLRALSTSGELVKREKSFRGARTILQVLDDGELEREFCARHPQWRADLAEGLRYSAPAEAKETKDTEEVVLHAGRGGIGRRRTAVCLQGFIGTKHKVKRSIHCKLVARQSKCFFEFEKLEIPLSAASNLSIKGFPNMASRVELVNEDGQHMWFWGVDPGKLPVFVQAIQNIKMQAARQSQAHAEPILPRHMEVVSTYSPRKSMARGATLRYKLGVQLGYCSTAVPDDADAAPIGRKSLQVHVPALRLDIVKSMAPASARSNLCAAPEDGSSTPCSFESSQASSPTNSNPNSARMTPQDLFLVGVQTENSPMMPREDAHGGQKESATVAQAHSLLDFDVDTKTSSHEPARARRSCALITIPGQQTPMVHESAKPPPAFISPTGAGTGERILKVSRMYHSSIHHSSTARTSSVSPAQAKGQEDISGSTHTKEVSVNALPMPSASDEPRLRNMIKVASVGAGEGRKEQGDGGDDGEEGRGAGGEEVGTVVSNGGGDRRRKIVTVSLLAAQLDQRPLQTSFV
jgi:hypothetical protein